MLFFFQAIPKLDIYNVRWHNGSNIMEYEKDSSDGKCNLNQILAEVLRICQDNAIIDPHMGECCNTVTLQW